MKMSNKIRWFEISAVLTTGVLKFLFVNVFELKSVFILISITFWFLYIMFRVQKNNDLLVYWGFTKINFWKCFRITGLFALICIIVFIANAILNGYQFFNSHIFYVLLLYPVWGIIQQFLIMGLVLGNLIDMASQKIPLIIIILFSSILFSTVHIPSILLTVNTFILAVFYSFVFIKFRNLYPLGIFHGWIGGLFYYYVLNQDPWIEIIQEFSVFMK